jgi:hypothetical protein
VCLAAEKGKGEGGDGGGRDQQQQRSWTDYSTFVPYGIPRYRTYLPTYLAMNEGQGHGDLIGRAEERPTSAWDGRRELQTAVQLSRSSVCVSVAVWCGSVGVWQYRRVAVSQYRSVAVWQYGSRCLVGGSMCR